MPAGVDDEGDRSWLPVALGFFLYAATAVASLVVMAFAQAGAVGLARAVAAGWVLLLVAAVVAIWRRFRKPRPHDA